MQIYTKENYEKISQNTASFIITVMKENVGGLFCFAGGDTPVLTLKLLAEEHQVGNINLHDYYYIELDEWIGLDENDEGSCISYLNEHLFSPAKIPKSNIHVFNAKSEDLESECQSANNYIEKHDGITLSLLGVGVNGHVGFNEPGTDFTLDTHIVELQNETKIIGQKYFNQEYDLDLGITLGIGQLLSSKYVLIMANGESKKTAISHLLSDNNPTVDWPVTAFKTSKNVYLFLDENLV